jgi:hypothetical protein
MAFPTPKIIAELRDEFLEHPLLQQFKSRPEKLIVDIPEKGCARLYLTNFPELDKSQLEIGWLRNLTLHNFRAYDGHIMSGSPDGISIQYKYEVC